MFVKGDLYIEASKVDKYILNKLTFENPQYSMLEYEGLSTKGIPKYFYLYKKLRIKGKLYYRLPKYSFAKDIRKYKIKKIDKPIEIESKLPKGFLFNISQVDTIQNATKQLKKYFGCFIVANPGEGKTTMAIRIICNLKQKTLVLVQKDTMIEQWRDALLRFTNLQPHEIGLLQQGKFVDGKVVIGSQQSLMNNTIGKEIDNLFGLKIQDEAHKTPAPMFLKANVRFRTMYHLGLSATPNREDKLDAIYRLYVSDNFVEHKNIRSVQANYRVYKYRTYKDWVKPYYKLPYKVQLINNIVKDDRRISFIVEILKRHKSRNIVILGERIPHLKAIMDICKDEFPNKNIVRFFGNETTKTKRKEVLFTFKKKGDYKVVLPDGTKTTLVILHINKTRNIINYVLEGVAQYFISAESIFNSTSHPLKKYVVKEWKTKLTNIEDVTDPTLAELHKADWIFATQKKMGDAIDIPHLDTILYATPFGSGTLLKQSKGRVERFLKGKRQPLVIDILDIAYSGAIKYFNKREYLYIQLKMKKLSIKNKIKI